MKTFFILLYFASFLLVKTHAQQTDRFNPAKNKREVNGYTIQLLPLPGNTFGFTVLKNNRPVYVQITNPFSNEITGLNNKEDAYTLAGWVVEEDKKNGKPPHNISPAVAKQLHLQPALKMPVKK